MTRQDGWMLVAFLSIVRIRLIVGAVVSAVALVALTASSAHALRIDVRDDGSRAGGPVATSRYLAPISGPISIRRPFQAPPTPYAAGHRGTDLTVEPNDTVLASAAGVVRFAGDVAGRGVVVIAHPDGVSTEYEPVRALVHTGASVSSAQPIGWVDGAHSGCATNECLHWSARRSGSYFDPMTLLRTLGPVRLIPW